MVGYDYQQVTWLKVFRALFGSKSHGDAHRSAVPDDPILHRQGLKVLMPICPEYVTEKKCKARDQCALALLLEFDAWPWLHALQ